MRRASLPWRQRHREVEEEWADSFDAGSIIDPESVTHQTPNRNPAISSFSHDTARVMRVYRVECAMFLGLANPRLCKSLARSPHKNPCFFGRERGLLRALESTRPDQHKIITKARHALAAHRDDGRALACLRLGGLLYGYSLHDLIVREGCPVQQPPPIFAEIVKKTASSREENFSRS